MKTKVCSHCNIEKPITEFSKNRSTSDGYQYWCNGCRYKYANRKGIHTVAVTCIVCGCIIPTHQSRRKYCDKCKGNNEDGKNWRKNNPLKAKFMNTKNYLKRLNKYVIHNFTYEEWIDKLKETNGYCPECGKYVGIDSLTLDHIVPISSVPVGTIYTIGDVQPLCKSCNSKKHDKVIVTEIEMDTIFKNKTFEEYLSEAREMLYGNMDEE